MWGGGSTTFRHVVVYQRDAGRRLEGAEEAVNALVGLFPAVPGRGGTAW